MTFGLFFFINERTFERFLDCWFCFDDCTNTGNFCLEGRKNNQDAHNEKYEQNEKKWNVTKTKNGIKSIEFTV